MLLVCFLTLKSGKSNEKHDAGSMDVIGIAALLVGLFSDVCVFGIWKKNGDNILCVKVI